MKAPDKIYMPNELLSEDWTRHIEGEDTVYIRKDALLGWAEDGIKLWKDSKDFTPNFKEGILYVFNSLKLYINSL